MSQYRKHNYGAKSSFNSNKRVHKYLKEYNMYDAYKKSNDGLLKEDTTEFSTASSMREVEFQENSQLNGFSITVCGETIIAARKPSDVYKKQEEKYAMSKEVTLPRVEELPQPIFLLDD